MNEVINVVKNFCEIYKKLAQHVNKSSYDAFAKTLLPLANLRAYLDKNAQLLQEKIGRVEELNTDQLDQFVNDFVSKLKNTELKELTNKMKEMSLILIDHLEALIAALPNSNPQTPIKKTFHESLIEMKKTSPLLFSKKLVTALEKIALQALEIEQFKIANEALLKQKEDLQNQLNETKMVCQLQKDQIANSVSSVEKMREENTQLVIKLATTQATLRQQNQSDNGNGQHNAQQFNAGIRALNHTAPVSVVPSDARSGASMFSAVRGASGASSASIKPYTNKAQFFNSLGRQLSQEKVLFLKALFELFDPDTQNDSTRLQGYGISNVNTLGVDVLNATVKDVAQYLACEILLTHEKDAKSIFDHTMSSAKENLQNSNSSNLVKEIFAVSKLETALSTILSSDCLQNASKRSPSSDTATNIVRHLLRICVSSPSYFRNIGFRTEAVAKQFYDKIASLQAKRNADDELSGHSEKKIAMGNF